MRQTIIFALIVNLAFVAVAPVLVCASPLSQITRIDAAKTQCDEMDMADSKNDASQPSVFAQSGAPCCMVSQVPRPEAQYSAGTPLVPVARLSNTNGMHDLFVARQQVSAFQEQNFSPPDPQSLLCTFLV
jgi:hypothetical protein